MSRFIQLAVVAVILYFGITQGLPWVQRQLGMESGSGFATEDSASLKGDGGACVATARDASLAFGDEMRQFSRPPVDVSVWNESSRRLANLIDAAENACFCAAASCHKAASALSELRAVVDRFDEGFRGQRSVPLNTALDQRRINDLLDEAQALAREGSQELRHARPDFVGWHVCGMIDTWVTLENKEERQHTGLKTLTGEFYPEVEATLQSLSRRVYEIAVGRS